MIGYDFWGLKHLERPPQVLTGASDSYSVTIGNEYIGDYLEYSKRLSKEWLTKLLIPQKTFI